MKKFFISAFFIITIILCQVVDVYADSDSYETFNEIMLTDGKLLVYFTDAEYEAYFAKVKKTTFWGLNVYVVNDNVDATYISSTLYSVENRGQTDVNYELDIVVETARKTTWSVSASANGTAKGNISSYKAELAAKAGVEYNDTTTSSKKETQKLKVTVEKNSRAIVYLIGNARVTNGVCAGYIFFVNTFACGFEYFTIINQYPRMEKRSL